MNPESIFLACSALTAVGWVILIFISPFWFQFDKLVIGIIIALLAIVYAWLIITNFKFEDVSKFGSLDGVMELFTNKTMVTAGWIHYCAFDLMVGIWIKRNSLKYGISHMLLVPCLLVSFMLGPIGFLLYLLIRSIKMKQYFLENF